MLFYCISYWVIKKIRNNEMYTLHNNSKANNHALHVDHTKFTLYIGSTNFLKNKANK